MLVPNGEGHYLSVGISAAQNIFAAIEARGLDAVSGILDMPCGHGRITRVLRAAFPHAKLSVCDLDEDGVAFCTKNFDAKPLISRSDFRSLNFGEQFDLIWVGSLITHLPQQATRDFIAFALRHLSPRGVAVVSAHGSFSAGRMYAGDNYGIEPNDARQMMHEYFATGYGYADYPTAKAESTSYGISLTSRRWIKSSIVEAGGDVLSYCEHAWDCHHDVVAFSLAS